MVFMASVDGGGDFESVEAICRVAGVPLFVYFSVAGCDSVLMDVDGRVVGDVWVWCIM